MSGQGSGSPPTTNATTGSSDDAYLKKQKGRSSMTWIGVIVVIVIVIALVGGAYAAGWIGKSSSNSGTGYQPPCALLTAGGSTFVYPLMSVWATNYAGLGCSANNGYSSVDVVYNPVGSGTGITDLTDKIYAFGASDAPLTYAQTSALPGAAVTLPDSAGAVTIMYNIPKVATGLNLTGPLLAAIFLGDIVNWNNSQIAAINAGVTLPNQPITVEHRSDGSGTTYAFTSYLSDENTTWKNTVGAATTVNFPVGQGQHGSEAVAGAVASTAGSIGYAELNYAEGEGSALGIAKILNPANNYIMPNVADTAAAVAQVTSFPSPTGNWSGFTVLNQAGASTYPIATFTYVMTYTDVGKVFGSSFTQQDAQALVSFLWWITHTGQSSATGLFYVPLPAAVTAVDEAAIGDIQFNGAALTSH